MTGRKCRVWGVGGMGRRQEFVQQKSIGSICDTRNRAQSMTATALATYPVDADDSFVARQLHIGLEHYAAGAIEEAIAAYQIGLAAAENKPAGHRSAATISTLHSKLGNACMVR